MTSATEITNLSATQLARRIANGELSAREVCAAHIRRCEQTHKALNALVWTRFEAALQDAIAIDEKTARGEPVGPLAGVPFTVKECFFVEGSPACLGLSDLASETSGLTGVLVQRLKRSGAVLLGKTNVPQLMLWHECDNPVYGRTNNPWDLERTPGGSTGGEAALVAAGGSALGLGNDLGGSIRIPAAWCGVQGLMATPRRLPNEGALSAFRGLEAIVNAAGPVARSVEDLALALEVLADHSDGDALHEIEPWPLLDFRNVAVSKLRIGVWATECHGIKHSPAIYRAMSEAESALTEQGATLVPAPHFCEVFESYVSIVSADGGANWRWLTKGSMLDWRLKRIQRVTGMGRMSRALLVAALRILGQRTMADVVSISRPHSAAQHWQLVEWLRLRQEVAKGLMDANQFDAILCPIHPLPAPQHGKPIDLVAAAYNAFAANYLGWPAGVVSTTTVREDEQTGRPNSRDRVLQQAAAVDAGSAGLPVGVQVIARPWREDIVLAVMAAIERALPRPKLPDAQLRSMCSSGK
jgi:fatty acid amide hydrolase